MSVKTLKIFFLSETDRRIINLVADGLTSIEIGKIIFFSPRTIEKRIQDLHKNYKVKNSAALVSVCYQNGILTVKPKETSERSEARYSLRN